METITAAASQDHWPAPSECSVGCWGPVLCKHQLLPLILTTNDETEPGKAVIKHKLYQKPEHSTSQVPLTLPTYRA